MNGFGRIAKTGWNRLRTRQRLESLSESAAADFGVSRADLCEAALQKGDVPERMERMSAVFGAGAACRAADRYRVLDMSRVCTCCTERHDCTHLLYGAAGTASREADFCPNAAEFRALAKADGGRRVA